MTRFSLTMHPASEGDALVLTWGSGTDLHHAVIDLGRKRDYAALRPWLVAQGRVDLLVISHIDADHIEGAMPLVAEPAAPFAPGDVWFNALPHLQAAKESLGALERLSVLQGEKLSDGIRRFRWPWNAAFGGSRVSTDTPAGQAPVTLPGGLRLTLLGPSDRELAALEPAWDRALAAARLRIGDADEAPPNVAGFETLGLPGVEALAAVPFTEDGADPNGSSITLLAEYGGKRVLLGADAHPGTIARRLAAMGYGPDNRLRLDLFKLCHHGSRANLSPDLLAMLDCTRFAISTDGSKHNHPNPEAIARILVADPARPKVLYFNTRQVNATCWDTAALTGRWAYRCEMPPGAAAGLTIDI